MARKAEYPALLPGGFHTLSIEELRKLCVLGFPLSRTRPRLMQSLEVALEKIRAMAVPADVWIDGSFLTKKIDPSDVDLAVVIPFSARTAPNATVRETLDWIVGEETRTSESIDGHVLTKFPDTSRMAELWHAERRTYLTLFGTEYDDKTPKGIALMKFFGGA